MHENDTAADPEVAQIVGRAEREAAAILAEYHGPVGERTQTLLALAWSKGYLTGYGELAVKLDRALERIERDL